jgi:hypothetical protein
MIQFKFKEPNTPSDLIEGTKSAVMAKIHRSKLENQIVSSNSYVLVDWIPPLLISCKLISDDLELVKKFDSIMKEE